MSAAEKLRALAASWPNTEGITSDRPAGWSVMDALPQIVAVVEAAEAVAGPAAYRDGLTGRAALARDALSALDEKLGKA